MKQKRADVSQINSGMINNEVILFCLAPKALPFPVNFHDYTVTKQVRARTWKSMAPKCCKFLLSPQEKQNSVSQELNHTHKYLFCYLNKLLVPMLSFFTVDDQTWW